MTCFCESRCSTDDVRMMASPLMLIMAMIMLIRWWRWYVDNVNAVMLFSAESSSSCLLPDSEWLATFQPQPTAGPRSWIPPHISCVPPHPPRPSTSRSVSMTSRWSMTSALRQTATRAAARRPLLGDSDAGSAGARNTVQTAPRNNDDSASLDAGEFSVVVRNDDGKFWSGVLSLSVSPVDLSGLTPGEAEFSGVNFSWSPFLGILCRRL